MTCTLDIVAATVDYINSLQPAERQEWIQRATAMPRHAPTLPGDYTCEVWNVVAGV